MFEWLSIIIDFFKYLFTNKQAKRESLNNFLIELRDVVTNNQILPVSSQYDFDQNKVRMERVLSVMEQGSRMYFHYMIDRKSYKEHIEEDYGQMFRHGTIVRDMIFGSQGYHYLKRYYQEVLNQPYTSRNKPILIFIIILVLIYLMYRLFF